jgi:hypothetical protein
MKQEETRKARQAAYAAKHRKKAKAIRRPDARIVESAYFEAFHVFISEFQPDLVLRGLSHVDTRARHILARQGYDPEQVADKISNMKDRLTATGPA